MRMLAYLFSFFCTITVCARPYQHNDKKVALSGYDVTTYYNIKANADPSRGNSKFKTNWSGVTWYFNSEANLKAFKKKPTKFAPLYLGYCAYAASQNYIYKGEPLAWTVHKGKLYLNADKSVRSTWLKKKESYIVKSEKNWPSLKP